MTTSTRRRGVRTVLTSLILWMLTQAAAALSFDECRNAFASQAVSRCVISQGECSSMTQCARLARCYPGNRRCESHLSGGTWTAATSSVRHCAALGSMFVEDGRDEVVTQVCGPSLSDAERAARVRTFSANLQAQDNADLALAGFLLRLAEGFSRPSAPSTPRRPLIKEDPREGAMWTCSALARRHADRIDADMRARMAKGAQPSREWMDSWERLQRGRSPLCTCVGKRAAEVFDERELAETRSRTRVWGQLAQARLEEAFEPCARETFGSRAQADVMSWLIPSQR